MKTGYSRDYRGQTYDLGQSAEERVRDKNRRYAACSNIPCILMFMLLTRNWSLL